MALVRASQSFVLEGHTQYKEKSGLFTRNKYVRKTIHLLVWVETICDESESATIIEEKIKEKMKRSGGWGKNFEGWSLFRKYCEPGEFEEHPNGKEFKLKIEYIRDWKMQKILETLDGNQFAVLCKELGISAEEVIARS